MPPQDVGVSVAIVVRGPDGWQRSQAAFADELGSVHEPQIFRPGTGAQDVGAAVAVASPGPDDLPGIERGSCPSPIR